jgi:hypothetical protein
MSASLHIAGTSSSVLDSVFVCRKRSGVQSNLAELATELKRDIDHMRAAGVTVSEGDRRCLIAGHIARLVINRLHAVWDRQSSLEARMALSEIEVLRLKSEFEAASRVGEAISSIKPQFTRRKAIAATV